MIEKIEANVMLAWARRNLPARLSALEAAKALGFGEYDIPILMAAGKLTPLGNPAPNAVKWFASVEIIRLATDVDWLHKATKELARYWRNKRARRRNATWSHVLPTVRQQEVQSTGGEEA